MEEDQAPSSGDARAENLEHAAKSHPPRPDSSSVSLLAGDPRVWPRLTGVEASAWVRSLVHRSLMTGVGACMAVVPLLERQPPRGCRFT